MNLKKKIWLTIAIIVLMFSFFTLYYFPDQQAKLLLENYDTEVQNLANTVSLGVKIAFKEQNFEGVQTAMEFVKDDPRLEFISLLQYDTVWSDNRKKYQIKEKVFRTYPEDHAYASSEETDHDLIIKHSPFKSEMMSGAVKIGFSTEAISDGKKKIRFTSLIVSGLVLCVGILIGFWLSKTISGPVLALRNAAIKVGKGDFNTRVNNITKDEIGDLSKSFNEMVTYLALTTKKLQEANSSLESTNERLNNTVQELKSTQDQLIQKEKMASLGELTAGIAHEIQNPLNFVNNFSELNNELLEEMIEEYRSGDKEEAEELARAIKQNEEKIILHGKRADSIVKGMLQHSRSSTGEKELTDINALADEFLRLSYHGLRATDKSFNAKFSTDFDPALGKINIAPEEIGRVLLNLYNNAFYSVNEKKKQLNGAFEPTITVKTKAIDNTALISIVDNGLGVPQKVIDKIFQPFFTTKPTGEGTGLGLSLSYDIVTKGHGGELKVETIEGQGAEFTIKLPC